MIFFGSPKPLIYVLGSIRLPLPLLFFLIDLDLLLNALSFFFQIHTIFRQAFVFGFCFMF
jgi:hypothetical protein